MHLFLASHARASGLSDEGSHARTSVSVIGSLQAQATWCSGKYRDHVEDHRKAESGTCVSTLKKSIAWQLGPCTLFKTPLHSLRENDGLLGVRAAPPQHPLSTRPMRAVGGVQAGNGVARDCRSCLRPAAKFKVVTCGVSCALVCPNYHARLYSARARAGSWGCSPPGSGETGDCCLAPVRVTFMCI